MKIYKIEKILKREWKTTAIAVIFAFIVSLGAAACTYADRVNEKITDSVVRFHVLANSDREYDQELKLKVRDAVLEYLKPGMEKCESREEAEKYLAAHIYGINSMAEKVINEEGYEYDVKTELSKEHYPVRYYANAAFPEGVYQSLRVTIGNGEGHNWWCVMYPPLCLNGQSAEYTDTDMLKDVIGEEGYEVVVLSQEETVPQIKFKVVEWFSSVSD